MGEHVLLLVLKAWSIIAMMMTFLWLLQANRKNAGFVDIGWTLGLAICALVYALNTPGLLIRKMLILMPVCLWAGRLCSHLIQRLMQDPSEDKRYAKMREDWQNHQNLKFFAMFQFQGLLDVVLSLPFLLICLNPSAVISPIEMIGVTIILLGLTGESIADAQLKTFKEDPANKGKVCDVGLWHYSRHPNYFFEVVIWIGYFIFALTAPWGIVAILAPIIMLYLLLKVSGVPLAEEQSLKSKGEAYRRYQATTSVFIPLPRKTSA